MKNKLYSLFYKVFLIAWLLPIHAYSQQPDLSNTLLVYILPDSLELPVGLKGNIPHTMATVRSQSLRASLDSIKPVGLSKAFPNWNNADSINMTKEGIKIKKPEFGRIFVFTFHSEKEADAIIPILKRQPSVLFVEKNMKPKLFQDPDYDNGTQWHLRNDGRNGGIAGADIHVEGAWAIFTGNPNITIGIFDTGVDINHPELTGRTTGDLPDGIGHGTHVAGLAAAGAHNNEGGRGVDWAAQIFSQRIFNSGVYTGDADVANRITTTVNNGVQVLNNSWGGPTYSTILGMAFAYAYKKDRTVVAAMGNDGGNVISYPAAFNNVIAVGATTNRDEHSAFSNTGNHISVSAPGGENPNIFDPRNVFSTWLNNGYQFDAGTSMSTPQASGLASLLRGFNTNLANDDVRNIIELSADDVNAAIHPGWDNELGFGRINAERALTFLRDNTLSHWSTSGGTVFSTSSPYVMQILGATGLASGNYTVYRKEIRTNVIFPAPMCTMIGAWGRGVGSTGWNMGSPNYGEGFCQVVPGTLTTTGATLRTYVYDVYNMLGQHLGYYPSSPQSVTFQYTVLGVPILVPTTIYGNSIICSGTSSYSLPSLSPGTTVQWQVSDPSIASIDCSTCTQVTLTKISNGPVTLSANVTTCSQTITLYKTVIVGTPTTTCYEIGLEMPCYKNIDLCLSEMDSWQSIAIPGYWGQTGDRFHLQVFGGGYFSNGLTEEDINGNYIDVFVPNNGNNISVYVWAANSCGSSYNTPWGITFSPNYGCYGGYYVVSPNPAQSSVTVSLNKDKTDAAHSSFDQVNIYDQQGNLKLAKKFGKVKTGSVNVANLSNGIYVVEISNGAYNERQQLIIQK